MNMTHEQDQIKVVEARIIAQLEQDIRHEASRLLYEDSDFYQPSTCIHSRSSTDNSISWCRPGDPTSAYFQQSNDSDWIPFARDNEAPGDGNTIVDTRSFLGALSAVSKHKDGVDHLFLSEPQDFKTYGLYTCRLYSKGDWQEVVCDTTLPTLEDGQVILGASVDPTEVWAPFLVKAYAKMVGGYDQVHQVHVMDALLALTGGSTACISLGALGSHEEEQLDLLWTQCCAELETNILSCQRTTESSPHINDTQGLINGELYSIVSTKSIGSHRFVQLSHPWGQGQWTGSWSPQDAESWEAHPQVALALTGEKKGKTPTCFWMAFEDLVTHFNELYMTTLVDTNELLHQYAVKGEWTEDNVAGEPPVQSGNGEAPDVVQQKWIFHSTDADSVLHRNPQYRVRTTAATTVHLSFCQHSTGPERVSATQLMVVRCNGGTSSSHKTGKKGNNARGRLWELNATTTTIVADTQSNSAWVRIPSESVLQHLVLEPHTTYWILPSFDRKPIATSTAYDLRVFSSEKLSIFPVPRLYRCFAEGTWEPGSDTSLCSAGGPLLQHISKGDTNARWWQNPQLQLQLHEHNPALKKDQKSATIKVVLTRQGKVTNRVPIGMTVQDTPAPTFLISREEPCVISSYASSDLASVSWPVEQTAGQTPNPTWTITPTLGTVGQQGAFTIESWSELPHSLTPVSKSHVALALGLWSQGHNTAGGCHLQPLDWKKNPKFYLELFESKVPVNVRISLLRDEREWTRQVKAAPVASMIGFYLFHSAKCLPITTQARVAGGGAIFNSTDFVPMYRVETTLVLEPLFHEPYVIMPTTWEPNQSGKFVLQVEMLTPDVKFRLFCEGEQTKTLAELKF